MVFSKSLEEHVKHFQIVLQTLKSNQFYAKLSKCSFAQETIEYLGHIVDKEGVQIDKKKIQAMVEWPRSVNIKQLRGFLGLTGYYRNLFKVMLKLMSRPTFGHVTGVDVALPHTTASLRFP